MLHHMKLEIIKMQSMHSRRCSQGCWSHLIQRFAVRVSTPYRRAYTDLTFQRFVTSTSIQERRERPSGGLFRMPSASRRECSSTPSLAGFATNLNRPRHSSHTLPSTNWSPPRRPALTTSTSSMRLQSTIVTGCSPTCGRTMNLCSSKSYAQWCMNSRNLPPMTN